MPPLRLRPSPLACCKHMNHILLLFSLRLESLCKCFDKGCTLHGPVGNRCVCLSPPLVRKINDQSGAWCDSCHREHFVQNGALLKLVIGFTECMAEWPVEVEHTRSFYCNGQ